MTKKLNPIKVQRELIKRNISVFSPLEFQRIFDVTKSATNFFINFHLKKGFFVKIRNGLYMLADYPADHFMELFQKLFMLLLQLLQKPLENLKRTIYALSIINLRRKLILVIKR